MTTARRRTKLLFVIENSERVLSEALDRGCLSHVLVELDGSLLFPVTFYDAVRLAQDLDEMSKHGEPFIADPGMIVLERVTTDAMESAVELLASRNYFQYLIPVSREAIERSRGEWPPQM